MDPGDAKRLALRGVEEGRDLSSLVTACGAAVPGGVARVEATARVTYDVSSP